MTKSFLFRACFLGAALLCAAAGCLSLTTYYARYYSTMATLGVMQPQEHVRRVDKSLRYDSSHGYTNLLKARAELRSGRPDKALEFQRQGMKSFRPVRAYLQHASVLERLEQHDEAEKLYKHVVSVAPGQMTALERLAVLSYRRGDLERVEELAQRISEVDLNNPNPLYLKAIAAEKRGNVSLAYQRYQKISAAGEPAGNAIFDLESIRERLNLLKPAVGER